MATLKDVAKQAGVSIASVSYYINGTHTLNADTRARIQEAIEALGYIPNAQARNLKSRVSKELCAIFPDLENICYSEILQGVVLEAENAGYTLTIFCSYNDIGKEQELIEEAISKNCAGLLLVTCQPQHTEFFRRKMLSHKMKTVFLVRMPLKMDVMYYGFDNYNAIAYMTRQLLENGFRDIALLSGPDSFFSESEAIQGYFDTLDRFGIGPELQRNFSTDTSKEGAFSTFLRVCAGEPPQAVITTSQMLCQGVIEACHLAGLRIPEDICVLTLGVDNWNRSSFYPNVIRSSEPAYAMGLESCRYLIEQLETGAEPEVHFHMLRDTITAFPISLPKPRDLCISMHPATSRILKIAAADLPSIHSLEAVSQDLFQRYAIRTEFHIFNLHDLFDLICRDAPKKNPEYDIYLYDTSWFSYLSGMGCLRDLTDTILQSNHRERFFFSRNLANCSQNNRYYGFPIIGGTQFLLYRKDLFSDPQLCRLYKKSHYLSLRPPKTWKEFNSIARFFTRAYNPESPTQYGTAIASGLNEELILEYEPRMWGFGGSFFDETGHLNMQSQANRNALSSFVESTKYSKPDLQTNQDVLREFTMGNIPMIVTFTEYAAQIQSDLHSDYLLKSGYSAIPGNAPANVGWHFGLSPNTPMDTAVRTFFDWLYQRHTSYYMSILGGSSATIFPYHSHELRKLYPWLDLTAQSLENCRSRIYPLKKRRGFLAPNAFESILCDQLRELPQTPEAVNTCLGKMQRQILRILSE